MPTMSRMTLAATIAALLLAGCAEHPTTRSTTTSATPTTTSATTNNNAEQHPQRAVVGDEKQAATDITPSDSTGIAACDDYLSSYLACHRAAGIFAPDQLQYRYEAMRTSLLRDSQDPDIRPQLAARCNSLANQLRQALNGKPCASSPAPAASSP